MWERIRLAQNARDVDDEGYRIVVLGAWGMTVVAPVIVVSNIATGFGAEDALLTPLLALAWRLAQLTSIAYTLRRRGEGRSVLPLPHVHRYKHRGACLCGRPRPLRLSSGG